MGNECDVCLDMSMVVGMYVWALVWLRRYVSLDLDVGVFVCVCVCLCVWVCKCGCV